MSDLLNRRCRVLVYPRPKAGQPPTKGANTLSIEYPQPIEFKVDRNLKSSPNTCDITITNLSPESREFLTQKGLVVQLEAGHEEHPRLLFVGDVRYTASTYVSPNWKTQILAGDGSTAYAAARVSRSYKAGVTAAQILQDLASSLGVALAVDVTTDSALSQQFVSGASLEGWARDRLTELLAPFGYRWSIQDGKLQVLRETDVRPGQAFLIDEDNGLIGSPDVGAPQGTTTTRSITAKVLLYPEIVPGSSVKVVSKAIPGAVFRAERVSHAGSTHGGDWQTEVEGVLR